MHLAQVRRGRSGGGGVTGEEGVNMTKKQTWERWKRDTSESEIDVGRTGRLDGYHG